MKEVKTLFFIKKISNLRKIIILIMFFVIELSLTVVSYQFFKNWHIYLINNGLFSQGKHSPLFSVMNEKFFILKEIRILEDYLLVFKIVIGRVVDNFFPGKISRNLLKCNHLKKNW